MECAWTASSHGDFRWHRLWLRADSQDRRGERAFSLDAGRSNQSRHRALRYSLGPKRCSARLAISSVLASKRSEPGTSGGRHQWNDVHIELVRRFRLPGDLAKGVETVVADGVVSHVWEHTYLLWFEADLTPHLRPSKPPTTDELGRARWGIGGQAVWLKDGKVWPGSDRKPEFANRGGHQCRT